MVTLGGELIGVSSNDILGAEKAANEETTPLEGDPGEAVLDAGGGVPDDVEASLDDEEAEEVVSEVEVLSVERAGTVGAVR